MFNPIAVLIRNTIPRNTIINNSSWSSTRAYFAAKAFQEQIRLISCFTVFIVCILQCDANKSSEESNFQAE